MTSSRKFFADFVRRSFEEFRAKPHDEYLAKMAVTAANDMAERMLHEHSGTARVSGFAVGQERKYRDALSDTECEAFGIVRDVAEGHKHFRLDRQPRRVSSAEQTGSRPTRWMNSAEQEVTWVNNVGEPITWVSNVIVKFDDGTERALLPMLEEVVGMWDRLTA